MSDKTINVPVMWDLPQACLQTSLKKFTIMNWVKSGKVKFIRVGTGKRGKILVNAESLCRFMEGGEQA